MRIVCIGGGPAGLYFAISAKRRDAGHDITVIERVPPGATYGWGVVYWDDLLDILFRNDPDSAQAIRAASVLWQEQRVILCNDQAAYLPGYGFSVGRATLLDVLSERATELGIDIEYRHEVDDLSAVADADLVVVCDGANSRVRALHREDFGARVDVGGNPYLMAWHRQGVRQFHLRLRTDFSGVDLVSRLPLQRRDQHLHRGMCPADMAGTRIRLAEQRGRYPVTGEDF